MSYTTKMKVPNITKAMADQAMSLLPSGARGYTTIPTISTAEQAGKAAHEKMTEMLRGERYEFVREVLSVTLDADSKHWTVNLSVSGD